MDGDEEENDVHHDLFLISILERLGTFNSVFSSGTYLGAAA